MRQHLAEGIFKVTQEKQQLIAEMAKQMGVCYAFKTGPPNRVLAPDFFPFSTLPFEISKKELEDLEAKELMLQELLFKTSEDREFVNHVFRETKKADEFVGRLLNIYNETFEETSKQEIRCNIIRNDYIKNGPTGDWSLVEFNAMSPGSGTTSDRIQRLNYILSQTLFKEEYEKANTKLTIEKQGFANTMNLLVEGWKAYNNPDAILLYVWEGIQQNIHDEYEMGLFFEVNGIKVVRGNFAQLADRIQLKDGKLFYESDEVGMVLFRAGFLPSHYTSEKVWEARKTIERSQAVKVPTVGMQLVNFKRAQIDLCTQEVLKKYLGEEKAKLLEKNFLQSWDFDNEALQEDIIKQIIGHEHEYVLKPNLEAGLNNFYNEQILEILQKSTPEQRKGYILMRKIQKSTAKNVMFKRKEVLLADTITEAGFFGGILAIKGQIKSNVGGGNLVRSKFSNSEGGGIIAGFAVFDSFMLTQDIGKKQ